MRRKGRTVLIPKDVVAIVDVYSSDGTFLHRSDFRGPDADSSARRYAESEGEVVSSGSSQMIHLGSESILSRHSTFIPDGVGLHATRCEADDTEKDSPLRIYVVKRPVLSTRSPLHPQALVKDDLQIGMIVEKRNKHHGTSKRAAIIGNPYLTDLCERDAWKVRVAINNHKGDLQYSEWFLADMGVVPYGSQKWNVMNYTVRV